MSIIIDNLCFSYGPREVLKNISLEIHDGEFLSILGSNGAGKSTLFRCILGLLKPKSGRITIDGRNVHEMAEKEISSVIAYIPQTTSPAFNYSVEDIVLMGTTAGASAFRTPKREEYLRAEEALVKMGIENLRGRCFHHLSGGERQLVIIARALAQNTKILMLDEPTASLDFGNQILVLNRIKELSKGGYTIIQTTHNPEHSYMYSDRIAALKNGTIAAEGAPDAVITDTTVSSVYGIDVEITQLYNDKIRVCLPKGFER